VTSQGHSDHTLRIAALPPAPPRGAPTGAPTLLRASRRSRTGPVPLPILSGKLPMPRHIRSRRAPAPVAYPRAYTRQLRMELLEDRVVPANAEWWLQLTGLPGDTIDAQMQAARDLLLANGISEQRVAVVDHLTQDGNIIIQTPEDTPEETVRLEVQNLPGFVFVQPFVDGEEEEEGGGEPDPAGIGEGGRAQGGRAGDK